MWPLQWKHRVLTTRPPGKPHVIPLLQKNIHSFPVLKNQFKVSYVSRTPISCLHIVLTYLSDPVSPLSFSCFLDSSDIFEILRFMGVLPQIFKWAVSFMRSFMVPFSTYGSNLSYIWKVISVFLHFFTFYLFYRQALSPILYVHEWGLLIPKCLELPFADSSCCINTGGKKKKPIVFHWKKNPF